MDDSQVDPGSDKCFTAGGDISGDLLRRPNISCLDNLIEMIEKVDA